MGDDAAAADRRVDRRVARRTARRTRLNNLYLDTSAGAKLLVEEAESAALATYLDERDVSLVACALFETELRRLAVRHDLDQQAVTAVLDNVALYELPPSLYREAGLLPGRHLRTLDALHLAAAIRLGVDAVVSYDERLGQAARAWGFAVVAPGVAAES